MSNLSPLQNLMIKNILTVDYPMAIDEKGHLLNGAQHLSKYVEYENNKRIKQYKSFKAIKKLLKRGQSR